MHVHDQRKSCTSSHASPFSRRAASDAATASSNGPHSNLGSQSPPNLPNFNSSRALARFLDTRAETQAGDASNASLNGSRSPGGGAGIGTSVVLRKRARSNSGSAQLDDHDYITFVSGAVLRVMEAQGGAVLREELEA